MSNDEQTGTSTAKSAMWVTSGHLIAQVIRLASNLIFTRLLAPDLFGVIGAAMVIMMGLHQLSDVGIYHSMIRTKNIKDQEFLNTIWVVQIGRGVVIASIMLIITLFLYKFGDNFGDTVYSSILLVKVMAILTIVPLLQGFMSPYFYILQRNMQFHASVGIELFSHLLGFLSGLVYAFFISKDIYALVSMQIVAVTSKVILSHIVSKFSFEFRYNKKHLKDIISYGSWVLVSSFIGFLFASGDRLILSANTTTEIFGIFTIAIFIAIAIKEIASKLVVSVLFAAIGKLVHENKANLAPSYYSIKFKADAILFFIAGGLFVSGIDIVNFLYDERYAQAGRMLKIMSFSILNVAPLLCMQLLMAQGKSKQVSVIVGIQTTAFYVAVLSAIHWFDIWIAIWTISLFSIFQLALATFFEYRVLKAWPLKNLLVVIFAIPGVLLGLLGNQILAFIGPIDSWRWLTGLF